MAQRSTPVDFTENGQYVVYECITDSVHESIQLSLALREPEFRSIDDQNVQVAGMSG